jgi:hypothetical protein
MRANASLLIIEFTVTVGDETAIRDKKCQGRRSVPDLASVDRKKVAASIERKRDQLPKIFELSHAQ